MSDWTPPKDAVVSDDKKKKKAWTPPSDAKEVKKKVGSQPSELEEGLSQGTEPSATQVEPVTPSPTQTIDEGLLNDGETEEERKFRVAVEEGSSKIELDPTAMAVAKMQEHAEQGNIRAEHQEKIKTDAKYHSEHFNKQIDKDVEEINKERKLEETNRVTQIDNEIQNLQSQLEKDPTNEKLASHIDFLENKKNKESIVPISRESEIKYRENDYAKLFLTNEVDTRSYEIKNQIESLQKELANVDENLKIQNLSPKELEIVKKHQKEAIQKEIDSEIEKGKKFEERRVDDIDEEISSLSYKLNVADGEDKEVIAKRIALLSSQKDNFFKSVEENTQDIVSATGGEIPKGEFSSQEVFNKYYDGLFQEFKELRKESGLVKAIEGDYGYGGVPQAMAHIGGVSVLADDESLNRYHKLQETLNEYAPIRLLNRYTTGEGESIGFFEGIERGVEEFAKGVGKTLLPVPFTSQLEKSQELANTMQGLGIKLNENVKESARIDEKGSFGSYGLDEPEFWGGMVGVSTGIMGQMAFSPLEGAQVLKYAKVVNPNTVRKVLTNKNLWGKMLNWGSKATVKMKPVIREAVENGISYQGAGLFFRGSADELGFFQGALGSLGEQGVLKVGKKVVEKLSPALTNFFTTNGKNRAVDAVVNYGKKLSSTNARGIAEVGEEFSQELVSIYQSDNPDFFNELEKRFGTMEQKTKFVVGAYTLGAFFDGSKHIKGLLTSSVNNEIKELQKTNPEQAKIVGEVIQELDDEMKTALDESIDPKKVAEEQDRLEKGEQTERQVEIEERVAEIDSEINKGELSQEEENALSDEKQKLQEEYNSIPSEVETPTDTDTESKVNSIDAKHIARFDENIDRDKDEEAVVEVWESLKEQVKNDPKLYYEHLQKTTEDSIDEYKKKGDKDMVALYEEDLIEINERLSEIETESKVETKEETPTDTDTEIKTGDTVELDPTDTSTDTDTEVVEEVKEEKPVVKKPVSKKKEAIESKSRKKKEVSPKKKSIEEKSRKKKETLKKESKPKITWKKVDQTKKNKGVNERVDPVKESAEKLASGEITNEQHQATVEENTKRGNISEILEPATEEQVKSAVNKSFASKVALPIEDGTKVGIRPDIPAFSRNNTWVNTVHSKGKKGAPVTYTGISKVKNPIFHSEPKLAIGIATKKQWGKDQKPALYEEDVYYPNGKLKNKKGDVKVQNKAPNAGRVLGEYVNFEGKTHNDKNNTAKAEIEKIANDPSWVQVSFNPFRSSMYVDRVTGEPVVGGSEAIVMGSFVYVKDPQYTTKSDPQYEVKGFKDSEGKPVKFQKDNVSEVGKLEKQAKTKSQKKALGHIANVIKALVKIDPNISIDVHQSQDSYTQAVIDAGGTKADAKSSGFYEGKDGSIQINLDMVKENTVLHEATHKIMGSYLKKNPKAITKFKAQLDKAGMLSSSDRKSLNEFVSQYDNKQEQDEEFVTEWLARVANGDIELSKSRIQAIIDLFNDLIKKIGLDPNSIKLTGKEDVIDFAKKLSEAFTTGKELDIDTLKPLEQQEQGTEGDVGTISLQKAEFSGSKGEKNFNRWKGDNKEYSGTDIQNIKTGEPVVVRAYHGTTNDFYEFDASVKGNVDGHLGAVNYFTSDIGDADQNYQTGGADLTSRIDQESEQLQYVIETEYTDSDTDTLYLENISEDFGVSKSELKGLNAEDIAHLVATKRLHGGTDRVLDVYVKLNNPAVIGLNQNWVEVIPESMYEEYMEDASEEIAEEYDVSVKEVNEDYSWEVKQRALEISGVENPLIEALQEAIDNNADYSSESAIEILEDFSYDEEVDLNQLESKVREGVGFAEGDRGMVGPQIVSDMFLNLGYDGIILRDVAQRFKNMGLGAGTSHIHVFDENSNQIKLADGTNVDFNEDTKDIRFQKNKELSEDNQHAQDYINAIKEGDALNEYDAQEVYDNLVEDGWDVTLDEVTKMFDRALGGTEVETEAVPKKEGKKLYNNENIYTDKKGKREQITEPELTEEGKSYDKVSQEKVREESTRILSENSVEVVEELARDKSNDMHPALRQDLLTELAKYYKRKGDTDKAYELMDVDAEEGTTDAQALAMRAGRQNDPELETMQIVRKNTKAEREFKSQPSNEKGKTNGDVISDSYKELQDMATELGIKVGDSEKVDKLIEKIVAKKISELSNKGVSKSKAKIKKARNERANITKEFKKNKGKLFYSSVIPGMTPEGIVHFGKIAKTYINEGVANVELLVEKLKEYAKTEFDAEISDEDLAKIKEDYFSIEVKETISDYKKELKDIIKEHYSVQDARKRELSQKIIDRLDLSPKEAKKIEKLVNNEFTKEAKAITEKTLTNTYGKTNLPKKQSKKVKDDVDKLLEAVNMGGFNDSMYANLIGSKFGFNTLTQEDIDFIDEYSEMIQTMEEGELKNRKIQELQTHLNKIKDVTKSEKIGKILLEVFYTSVLSGPTTIARGLKGGLLTSSMNTLVSALAQPKASFGATMAMLKGMHRFGTSSWFQILKDGYSDVDHFEFKPSGEGVLDALTNKTFKQHFGVKDVSKYEKGGKVIAKAFYHIPVRMYRMLIANDALMKSGLREFNAYIDVYNRELLGGNKNKVSRGFFTNLNKELSIDKTSIKQAEVQADQEIEKLKADGEPIILGYRGRRIQEIINAKREMQYKGNADYALEKANESLLMNDPIGTLGGVYRGLQKLTKVKEGKDDKFTIASRMLGKMMGFPFLKVASNFSNTAISYAPIVGTLQGVKRSVAGVRTKDGNRQLTPLEKREVFIKQAIGYTVTTALMMAIFDEDDDDNLVLSEDSWIQVSSNGPGSWAEGESVDPSYKRHSFRIRYSEGNYSDWYSYLDNPLGLVLAPIGILSDNVRFKQFKQRAKGNVEVSKVDKYDLLSPLHLPTFIGSQTYSQGLKNITTITQGIGETSEDLEKAEDKLAGMVVRQAKGMVFPNIYKQMIQQTDAYLGTERKYIKGLDKVVEDVPLLEDIVEGSDYDKFGNPIIRDFDVALVPDFILDGLKKNRKYREGKREWKVIYEFPEVNLGRAVKPPEDLTNKEKSNYKKVYGEIFKEEFLEGVDKLKRNKKYDALNVQILINRITKVNTKKTKKAIANKKK